MCASTSAHFLLQTSSLRLVHASGRSRESCPQRAPVLRHLLRGWQCRPLASLPLHTQRLRTGCSRDPAEDRLCVWVCSPPHSGVHVPKPVGRAVVPWPCHLETKHRDGVWVSFTGISDVVDLIMSLCHVRWGPLGSTTALGPPVRCLACTWVSGMTQRRLGNRPPSMRA